MRATLLSSKLGSTSDSSQVCVLPAPFIVVRSSLQCKSLRPTFIIPQSKGNSQYPSRRVPVAFGHSRAMMPIIIFCLGKIDRSSNKDGSDYEQNRP